MRTAVLIVALLAFLQGPVCPMNAFASPAEPGAPSDARGHDCCQGEKRADSMPAPTAPAPEDDNLGMAACAAHCAAMIQAMQASPFQPDAIAQAVQPDPLFVASPPSHERRAVVQLPPDRTISPGTIPLLI